jgi:predicted KAP-like P-loop ATPase
MRLTPKPLEIDLEEGFTEENDIFGYREFGERLANLVCAQEGPATLVLDGPWGTGKSTFMRQWAGLLRRERGVTVIEFNAFEND